jgi:citrate lyase subunit beta / citryl-CoA lyase
LSQPPIRSALFLPASNERAITKARTLDCDMAILDLEDAVAPEAKDVARAQAVSAIESADFRCGTPMVRINSLDTPWAGDDLDGLSRSSVQAVLIPKISSAHMLGQVRARLNDRIALWAMVETCAAILDIGAIASSGRSLGLAGFIIGPNDLAKEMRCRPDADRTPLLPALTQTIIAARAHGLTVLDGVYNDFRNADGLTAECTQGVMLGFDGKSLIHPDQIAITNAHFSPSEQEIAQAKAIADAFALPENAGKGVISVNGKMAELLHLAEARRILAIAARISA